MVLLVLVALNAATVILVCAAQRAGRLSLPVAHAAVATVMVVMATLAGNAAAHVLLAVILVGVTLAAIARRARCSTRVCWHLVGCAVASAALVVAMPSALPSPSTVTSSMAMSSMNMGSSMQLHGAGRMLALAVLVAFALLGAVDLAALVSRSGRALRAMVLERTALLTGSLAMVVMAALMLSGMPGDFA
ncbi:MAG: hypothetical protein QOG69_1310 [Actinomycetota bacterium]|jgi:hypothetical protein|nr:hypothetical protein [Actinomycetota bacterium]